jgi:hypothetical protein
LSDGLDGVMTDAAVHIPTLEQQVQNRCADVWQSNKPMKLAVTFGARSLSAGG